MVLRACKFAVFCVFFAIAAAQQEYKTQCVPSTPQQNVTLARGVVAGSYTRLGPVDTVDQCIDLVCLRGRGDRAYILGDVCYVVVCFSVESCEVAELPFNDGLRSVVVYMAWKKIPLSPTQSPTKSTGTTSQGNECSNTQYGGGNPNKEEKPEVGPDGKVAMSAEHRLLQDVLYHNDYDKEVRPVMNNHEQLKVYFALKLVQIVDVDGKSEAVRVNVWTTQNWKDPFLTWDPSDYGGIEEINVTPTMVWLPIIILYNNAANGFAGGPEKYKTKVVINSNGTVNWFAATQFLFSCKINIRWFPFDEQYCYMTFGSWTFSTKHMDMLTAQVEADMSSYIKNGEWEVIKTPVTVRKVLYPCCEDTFSDITYTFHLRRKVRYYVFNLIIPSTMIVVFSLIGFCLPPDSGERITLNITVLLSITVFLNIASNTLPSTSDSIPLLGYFYAMIMLDVFFAIVASTIVLRYNYCGQTKMPERMRIIINEWIASMLFFVITKKPEDKGVRSCMTNGENLCGITGRETSRSQSYIVARDDHALEERRISVGWGSPTKRNHGITEKQPNTHPSKYRSEPVLNTAGVVMETKLHRRKISSSPFPTRKPNINTVIQGRIVEGLDILTKRVNEENEKDDIVQEWQYAATVLDRLFFMIFVIIMMIPLAVFFFSSPEEQPPVT
ncbi:neuronal acetylcholine receptor subunit alpha-7 isoform X2 [Nematostella vectensis]|nr:neuronal acetylcholine receptor subunit alpha-7 isoform X2 [Nematostella vectensis]